MKIVDQCTDEAVGSNPITRASKKNHKNMVLFLYTDGILELWYIFDMEDKILSQEDFNLVLQEYEQLIFIPKQKPINQFFLCPVGLVGSGKTTVTKPLAERFNLIRISGDEIRKILHDKGYGYEKVWDIGSLLAEKYARLGYSVAMDTDCATLRTREALEKLAKELGAKVIYIHINPPEDFIINKLKNYRHSWLFKDGEQAIENYKQRKPLHERLNLPYLFRFDTSSSNLEQQIIESEKLIKAETGNE